MKKDTIQALIEKKTLIQKERNKYDTVDVNQKIAEAQAYMAKLSEELNYKNNMAANYDRQIATINNAITTIELTLGIGSGSEIEIPEPIEKEEDIK